MLRKIGIFIFGWAILSDAQIVLDLWGGAHSLAGSFDLYLSFNVEKKRNM